MPKIKKNFDRESMYKKIMPTNVKKEADTGQESHSNETVAEKRSIKKEPINLIKDEKNEVVLYNVTEKLVLNKLDATLKKMNCCKCDRCKEDIIAITLNNLKPMYIVATKEDIEEKIHKLQAMSSEVTTEVIKAVLTVRKNPRH
jgi:competence protein ComFB